MMDKYSFKENCSLDIEKSVAFTGHRELEKDFDYQNLQDFIQDLIEKGYENFFIGMAVGFDSVCFKVLESLKKSYQHINLIACIPCKEQDRNFSYSQKKDYRKMINNADYKVLISENYTPYCMQERNRFMVDNSSLVVAYMLRHQGGTYNTVKYAQLKGRKIINIVNK